MILTAENLDKIKLKTKRYQLKKADAEVNLALLPASITAECSRKKGITEDDPEAESFGLRALKAGVVDNNGNPVFETKEAFEKLPAAIQSEIMEAVFEYNGMTDGSKEELEKK